MRAWMTIAALAALLAGCQQVELQPIPGSITYGGQPRTKLTKAPIGSQVPNTFTDQWGDTVFETYIIQPDRSLKLVSRTIMQQPF
jgi:hypothetical protein